MGRAIGSFEVPIAMRERVIGARLLGAKNKDIAQRLGISPSTASRIYRRYLTEGSATTSPRSGRPSKLTSRDHRTLIRHVKRNRRATLHELAQALPEPCHVNTVRACLRGLGINSRIARQKPFLTVRHQRARLAWALERVGWNIDEWKRIIWTDEAALEIGAESRTVRVWRTAQETWHPSCIRPSFKSGRTSIMI